MNNQNIKLIDQIKKHPLCLRLEDHQSCLIVIFPYVTSGIDGIRIAKTTEDETLTRLSNKLLEIEQNESLWDHRIVGG